MEECIGKFCGQRREKENRFFKLQPSEKYCVNFKKAL